MTIENNPLPLIDNDFLRRCLNAEKVDIELCKTLITKHDITPYQVNLITSKMCIHGHLDVIKLAAIKGIDINFDNGDFITNAAIYGHKDILQFLIEELHADVQANKNAALRFASCNEQPEIIEYLLQKGADIHADNDCALFWAITDNKFKNTEVLAMAGKFKDAEGRDLEIDSWAKNDKMLCHLLALKIDISVTVEQEKRCIETHKTDIVDDVSLFSNAL